VNLHEQRNALIKAAQGITAKIKSENREATPEEITELKAKATELDEVDTKIKAAEDSAKTLAKFDGLTLSATPGQSTKSTEGTGPARKSDEDGTERTDAVQSLGEFFVKHGGVEAIQKASGKFDLGVKGEYTGPVRAKAATDTQTAGTAYAGPGQTGLLVPGFDTNVEMTPRIQPTIANLLGSGTTALTALTYFVQGAKDGAPAPTAELGRKPQVHYNWTSRTDTLKKIAGVTKISDEAIQDIAYLVSEIDGQLLYDLVMAEEDQLLNGTGVDPQIQGLLNRSGIQSITAVAADAAQDVIFRAMTSIQTAAQLAPDGVVIHPTTYQALRLKRDGNGQYFGGGFFQGEYGNGGIAWQPPLWGLRTVVTPAVPVNTVLVGAFRAAGTVYRKGGVRLESTNSNEDDFEFNRITIRAEERIMLQLRKPLAIAKVDISAAAAA
jgi:HK97 family phage major capsid protein